MKALTISVGKKHAIKSLFDDIPDVGPKRKKALILHFQSIKNIINASYGELREVKGITTKVAKKIYDFFNSQ